jgi:acetylornithine deacetylase/succinyl-diaminopimelate desuccinylase-like protein
MSRILILLGAFALAAQDIGVLVTRPDVKAALEIARRSEEETLAAQVRLSEIEAPPFKEARRGQAVQAEFIQLGLENVRVDAVGNVIGERRGRSSKPSVVFSAHLDTVFPEGTDVKVRREGNKLFGPGISDDSRGLAVLLATVRALQNAKVQTEGPIIFVSTVGEEGLGDLRGVKHLVSDSLKGRIDRFVSIDGTGLTITHVSIGSHRYKVTFKGPGGHSYGAFGNANPIHALGRAIAAISDLKVPAQPKTTFNVGRIQGGTSVNSIAFEAWFEVDLRSPDPAELKKIDSLFKTAVEEAVSRENQRWNNRGAISATTELSGIRPAAVMPEVSHIVQTAMAATAKIGVAPPLREGSTDANIPMSLSIPAITIGGGGLGTGAHSLGEAFDATNSWQGTQRAVLLAIALAH